jgi:hypothetical protein
VTMSGMAGRAPHVTESYNCDSVYVRVVFSTATARMQIVQISLLTDSQHSE